MSSDAGNTLQSCLSPRYSSKQNMDSASANHQPMNIVALAASKHTPADVLLCAQGDLFKKLIRSGGSLEEKYVAGEVILPLVLTLEHLHARGIYHRDIKPENIFFTKEG